MSKPSSSRSRTGKSTRRAPNPRVVTDIESGRRIRTGRHRSPDHGLKAPRQK